MVGYDIFGNKADVIFYSTRDALYKKIFFPEIAEKIISLNITELYMKDFLHHVIFGERYMDANVYSTLLHIAYFIEDDFRDEIAAYIEDGNNSYKIIRLLSEDEKDKYPPTGKKVDIVRLQKECQTLLNTYKYLEA